jgi:hypothetical protein
MARYISNIKIKGTLHGMTYRETRDGSIVQETPGPTREEVLTSPKFANTRKTSKEFEMACSEAKTLRNLFIKAIPDCYDNRVQRRIVSALRKVINSDTVSTKGERNLLMGNNRLLKGFEWNKHSSVERIMGTAPRINVDRENGQVMFHFESFVPTVRLDPNEYATHYQITAAIGELTWRNDESFMAMHTTEFMPLNNEPTKAFSVMLSVSEESKRPIACVLAIRWFKETYREMYPLLNSSHNAAAIVEVDVV